MSGQSHHKAKGIPPGYWIMAVIVLVVVFFFVLMPAIRGYSIYREMKAAGVPGEYAADMIGLSEENDRLEAELVSVKAERDAAISSRDSSADAERSCTLSLAECNTAAQKDKQICEQLADSLSLEKGEATSELKKCEEETHGVLADAAERLCCIERVFDSGIVGYEIEDDEIVCVTSGGTTISC